MRRMPLTVLVAALATFACSSGNPYTPGGGANNGAGGGGTNGTQTNATTTTGTTGTSGTPQGSASLGGFGINAAYNDLAPDAGAVTNVNVVLFAAADGCSLAASIASLPSTTQVDISFSGTPAVTMGSYQVGEVVGGQSASVAVNVAFPDAGEAHYDANQGTLMVVEVDGTAVSGTLGNVTFPVDADGGFYPPLSGTFTSYYCPGLP